MERNRTIDTAKFVCLVLMIFGHIPPIEGRFYQVVNSFHMPFFFFASGLFFNPDRFGFKKGFDSLLLPYFVFNFFIVGLNSIFEAISTGFISLDNISGSLMSILLGSSDSSSPYYPMPIGPSWFLISLFTVKICAKNLLRLKTYWTICIVVTLFCIIGVLKNHLSWFVFSLDSSIIGLSFFFLAFYLKQHFLIFLSCKWVPYIFPFLLIGTSFSWVNGWVIMFAGKMGDSILLFLLFAIIGILMVVSLSKYLRLPSKLVDTFNFGAVFLICMNTWFMEYIMLLYKKTVLHDLMAFLCWYEKLGILFSILVISYPCILFLSRITPCVLGRRQSKA